MVFVIDIKAVEFYGYTEGAEGANVRVGAAGEKVSKLINESGRLRVGRKSGNGVGAAEGEEDFFPCGLALLNIYGHIGAGEEAGGAFGGSGAGGGTGAGGAEIDG